MARRFLVTWVFLLGGFTSGIWAEQSRLKPLLVLVESNPWDIGSQWASAPTFALYEGGLVIYHRLDLGILVSSLLGQKQQEEFLRSLPLDEFRTLQEEREVSRWSHPPYNEIYLWDRKPPARVAVMGFLRKPKDWAPHPSPEFAQAVGEERAKTPSAFLQLFDALVAYESAEVFPWSPTTIEVLLWPLADPPANPLAWPPEWPTPGHPDVKRLLAGYTVVLDAAELGRVKQLQKHLQAEGQAVLFDGQAMVITSRIPFPGEEAWRSATFSAGAHETTETADVTTPSTQ